MLLFLIGILGAFIIVANWVIVFNTYVRRKPSSWAPLLGGVFTAVGLTAFPFKDVSSYWWIPFVVDYGCLPGLIHMTLAFLLGAHKSHR